MGLVAASLFGILAAVLYTLANIALRGSVGVDPFLVSAVKASPTVVVLLPWLLGMWWTGQTIATSLRMIPRFVLASLIAQFVGNAAFQVALEVIGLAASVPITLGVLIIGGAVLGRLMLHEPVRLQTLVAMVLLITAVVVLSLPGSTLPASSSRLQLPLWVGALCAAASGGAYALFGVVLRQTLNGGMSAPLTLFLSGVVGVVSLWSTTVVWLGMEPLQQIDWGQWGVMVAAGVFNTSAFIALSLALKSLPVVAVNLINASQVAMAAVAGVMLFAEPVTWSLISGIALTFAGLLVLAKGRVKRRPLARHL